MSQTLKYAFLEFVNRHELILPKSKILLAASGGIDSMVLLHLLQTWRRYFKLDIVVAHYNHQIRGVDADADEQFLRTFCRQQNLPFRTESGDVPAHAKRRKMSLEAAARALREDFLKRCADSEGCQYIATAHHLNDQAETILMRMMKGVGLEGLAGIRLRRDRFIRPLLFAGRQDIETYAKAAEISFREDPSNEDLRFLRNRIRHRLMPLLQEEFHLKDLEAFLRMSLVVQEWLPQKKYLIEKIVENDLIRNELNKIGLEMSSFRGYFSGIQKSVLEYIVSTLSGKAVKLSYNVFGDFVQWAGSTKIDHNFYFPYQIAASRHQRIVWFEKKATSGPGAPVAHPLRCKMNPGDAENLQHIGATVSISWVPREEVQYQFLPEIEYLDGDQLKFPLILRSWRPGDKFNPLGAAYQKNVAEFLTDTRSKLFPKGDTPVFESNGEIVAVVGARISESVKVTAKSSRILKIEISKALRQH